MSDAFEAARRVDKIPNSDDIKDSETIVPVSNSTSYQGNAKSIRIAAILIFIAAGLFALVTLENIGYMISHPINFSEGKNSWYAIMTIFGVFLGIEVLKKSAFGYSRGLYMGGFGVIWYGYQAISSLTFGYFVTILCAISYLLIISNSRMLAKEHRSTDDVAIRLVY